ncbi:TIGR03089 family protein [uncultured Arthrobacter sp.]|uniref:TIGR03089 family protein n=1 Tax=uncultured Arthrobacter sp. TaxID=114050 RepID=UPI0025F45377|nr:TIGR03089 family protein [uncultured Arthrobacter sp.]
MDQHALPTAVLSRLREATSPRLVWYGPDGRIELSGRVFDNWVAKTANLLVEELDAEAGTRVELDLPVHWKSLVWALACWQVGAVLVPPSAPPGADPGPAAGADLVVTSAEREVAPPAVQVAVALGALALRWPAPLPAGAVDYAAEVRSYGDYFADAVAQDASTVLFDGAGPDGAGPADPLTVAGLNRLYAAAPEPTGVVLLGADTSLSRALAAALAVWSVDGTLVVVHPEVPITQSLLDGERVGARAAFAPDAG